MTVGHKPSDDAPLDANAGETASPPSGLPRFSAGIRNPFASLAYRDFRWLWLGMLAQASSMWAENVARSWLTWDMTHSGVALGVVNLCRAIPLLAIGMWGGVAADRFDKRKLLLIVQTWTLAVYILTAVLIIGGWIQLWHIYATAVAMGIGTAINQPVRTSFIPQLVPAKALMAALSLNSVAINISRLIGPALIGLLIAATGVGASYVVASLLYVGIIATTAMIRASSEPLPLAERPNAMHDLVEGFVYIGRNKIVLLLVLLAIGPLAFGFSYLAMLPVYITEVLHMGPRGFGLLQSIGSVGSLLAGLTIASRGNIKNKGLLMLGTGVAYGLAVMGMGAVSLPVLAIVMVIMASSSQTIFRAANNSSIFLNVPKALRGRVFSITLLETGMQPLAVIVAGSISDWVGVQIALMVVGAICVSIVVLVGLLEPRIRKL